jgi:hypothetical protein
MIGAGEQILAVRGLGAGRDDGDRKDPQGGDATNP